MIKQNETNLIKSETGVSILIFSFSIIALFAFIAMAIDSANLFLASTKMQNIGDSADMTSLNVRIERGPQMRRADGTLQCPFSGGTFIDETCVKNIILPIAGNLLQQNLTILGFSGLSGSMSTNDQNETVYKVIGEGFTGEINYIDCRPSGTSSCRNPETGLIDSTLSLLNEYEYFTTKITYDVPLMFMHTVPFKLLGINAPVMGNTFQLKATSHAILPALNVAVLADISGSMNDPASGGQTKLGFLKTALNSFVNNFRPDRDKISFWPFNLQVSPTQSEPVTPVINQGFDLASLTGKISALSAAGNTNPSDALLAAYEDFRTRGGASTAASADTGIIGNLLSGTKGEYTMVLFSDGAPTAMTANFAQYDPTNFTSVFEVGMRDPSVVAFNDIDNPDYLTGPEIMRAHGDLVCPGNQIEVGNHAAGTCHNNCNHWCEPITTSSSTVYTWGMPSPFYRTSTSKSSNLFGRLYNKTNYNTVDDARGNRDHTSPTTIQSNAQYLDQAYPTDNGGTNAPYYLGFKLPTAVIPLPAGISASSVFASEPAFRNETQGSSPTIHPTGFKKQFYNNLVAMSDFIRSQMGYIYTVGLGTPATSLSDNDPYQNVSDNFSRKDNLLARVAGDDNKNVKEFGFTNPFAAANCAYKPTATASDPVSPDCGIAWKDSPRKAESISTSVAADLDRIFQRISRQLQTKVVVDPRSRIGGAGNR